jgi:hypothetical protein
VRQPIKHGKLDARAFTPAIQSPLKVSGKFVLTSQSEVNAEVLIVVHFKLEGAQSTGTIPNILSTFLKDFLVPGTCHFHEVVFNFSRPNHEVVHQARLDALSSIFRYFYCILFCLPSCLLLPKIHSGLLSLGSFFSSPVKRFIHP